MSNRDFGRPLTMEEATAPSDCLSESAHTTARLIPRAHNYRGSEAGRNCCGKERIAQRRHPPRCAQGNGRVRISLKHGCSYCSSGKARIAYETPNREKAMSPLTSYQPLRERDRAALSFSLPVVSVER